MNINDHKTWDQKIGGHVTGAPKALLHLEAMGVMTLSAAAYSQTGLGWGWFAGLFLAPDLLMLGYLGGRKLGAATYNIGHAYIGPMVLLALGLGLHIQPLLGVGLIWSAHIGFDRLLGYGLKYGDGFGFTHLGANRRARAERAAAQA